MLKTLALRPSGFTYISGFARRLAGIELGASHEDFVHARLAPLAAEAGCEDLDAFIQRIREDEHGPAASAAIEALGAGRTGFFEHWNTFEALRRNIIPHLIGKRSGARRLAICSIPAGTGQQVYSLCILLKEHFPELSHWELDILAADPLPSAVERARSGRYSKAEVNHGLPARLLVRYFDQYDAHWAVREDLRRMVTFREIDLARGLGSLPLFDLVLVGNPARRPGDTASPPAPAAPRFNPGPREPREIAEQLRRKITPGGYLILDPDPRHFQTRDSFTSPDIDAVVFCQPHDGLEIENP
jgi:chemotaxis protein methyltransferase CheR